MLGLPKGWSYNLDFVIPGKSVTYNGTTYVIDPNWQDDSGYQSGLKYLNQHGICFIDKKSQALAIETIIDENDFDRSEAGRLYCFTQH